MNCENNRFQFINVNIAVLKFVNALNSFADLGEPLSTLVQKTF